MIPYCIQDIVEGTQVENFIKQNTVNYDGLKPDTKYELQVYVLTNYGYNSEQGLLIPFKTKTKCNKDLSIAIINLATKYFYSNFPSLNSINTPQDVPIHNIYLYYT